MSRSHITHWIIVSIPTLIAAFCVYVIYLGLETGDKSGIWIFVAFGSLFSVPLLVSLFDTLAKKSPRFKKIYDITARKDKPRRTTFVPHWFIMTCISLVALILIFYVVKGIITGILSFLAR